MNKTFALSKISPAPAHGKFRAWRRLPVAALVLLCSVWSVWAAGPVSSAETLLLTGGVVHTASGPVLTNTPVFVKDGRIETIGKGAPTKADKVVRLEGQHVYPGLIAASTSVGLIEIPAIRATRDVTEVGVFTPEVQSWVAVNPDSELIPVARANGIACIVPVPEGGTISGQSGLLALAGWTCEEMLVRPGVAMNLTWPSAQLDLTPKENSRDKAHWKSPEDQARERLVKEAGLQQFLDLARAHAKQPGDPVPALEAMKPFLGTDRPWVIRAEDIREIRAALRWTATNNLKMVLLGGRDSAQLATELAERHVPVIFEHVYDLPSQDHLGYDANFRAAAILQKAGVKVIFGFAGSAMAHEPSNLRNLPYEAGQAISFGLPEDEALKAITLYPAEVFGVADRLGSLDAGKDATFVVVDGSIFDDRAQVRRLWIAGREVSLESRHTRLYEKYRQRPRPKQ